MKPFETTSRLVAALIVGLLCAGRPGVTQAHAFVVAAVPGAGSAVGGERIDIDLRFNSRIDASRSRIAIVDHANAETRLEILPSDTPDHLQAQAHGLAPGRYRIAWYVLSGDGHITRGFVPFKVKAP